MDMKRISDNKIPGLNIETKHSKGDIHNEIIAKLVNFISHRITAYLNYNHITLTTPKLDLPLTDYENEYDISFLYREKLVLIQIKTRTLTKRELMMFRTYG